MRPIKGHAFRSFGKCECGYVLTSTPPKPSELTRRFQREMHRLHKQDVLLARAEQKAEPGSGNTCPTCGHHYTTSDGSDHRPEVCSGRVTDERD